MSARDAAMAVVSGLAPCITRRRPASCTDAPSAEKSAETSVATSVAA